MKKDVIFKGYKENIFLKNSDESTNKIVTELSKIFLRLLRGKDIFRKRTISDIPVVSTHIVEY